MIDLCDVQESMTMQIFESVDHQPIEGKNIGLVDLSLVLRLHLEVYVCKKLVVVKTAFESLMEFKRRFEKQAKSVNFGLFR